MYVVSLNYLFTTDFTLHSLPEYEMLTSIYTNLIDKDRFSKFTGILGFCFVLYFVSITISFLFVHKNGYFK